MATGLVPTLVSATLGSVQCSLWCATNFANLPNLGTQCTLLAVKGEGPCYTCGPLKKSSTAKLCNGVCKETSNDAQNCGSCGKVCPTRSFCLSGSCVDGCSITYNPGGDGIGNSVMVSTGVATGGDCCQLCLRTLNCVASAYVGAATCQLLVKNTQLTGAPTSPGCPLGIENYNFRPGPGPVYVGPCASPPA